MERVLRASRGVRRHIEKIRFRHMFFHVYILRCNDNSYYTGHTDNLDKRLWEHKMGKFDGYTSTRLPVELVFQEGFHRREDAKAAELKIKTWNRIKKEALIHNGWEGIIALRKPKKSKNI